MNRTDLQSLSILRLEEAKVLLDHGRFEGAYYLAGYAVECGLKACIARQTKEHDFPDKELVNQSYTHDLGKLVRVAGLPERLAEESNRDAEFAKNWGIVKDWGESFRYTPQIPEREAVDLYQAIADPKHGVFEWLKKCW